MRRLLVPLALLGSLSFGPVCEAGVCSCVPPRPAAEAREAAAAVFTGRVVRVRDNMRKFRKTRTAGRRGW